MSHSRIMQMVTRRFEGLLSGRRKYNTLLLSGTWIIVKSLQFKNRFNITFIIFFKLGKILSYVTFKRVQFFTLNDKGTGQKTSTVQINNNH